MSSSLCNFECVCMFFLAWYLVCCILHFCFHCLRILGGEPTRWEKVIVLRSLNFHRLCVSETMVNSNVRESNKNGNECKEKKVIKEQLREKIEKEKEIEGEIEWSDVESGPSTHTQTHKMVTNDTTVWCIVLCAFYKIRLPLVSSRIKEFQLRFSVSHAKPFQFRMYRRSNWHIYM